MAKLTTVTVNELALSDWFFNLKAHDNHENQREDIIDVAKWFIDEFGLKGQVSPGELADDFLARV